MPALFLFLVGLAHAEAPRAGSGSLRATVGGGVSELGGSARAGGEAEVWIAPRVGLGARGSAGVDGLTEGRTLVVGELTLPLRPLGGEELSIVLVPGFGAAWHSDYALTAARDGEDVSFDAELVPRGYVPSASAAALLYGQMGFISLAVGPRVEWLDFQLASATANLGLGVGW